MLTTKKLSGGRGEAVVAPCVGRRLLVVFCPLALVLALAGCAPAGPRDLLEGRQLIERGKYTLAVEKLKHASTLLPTNALAWSYLGLALHHAGEPSGALEAYRKAIKLNHDLVVVHYNLGCLLLEQNKPGLNEAARDEFMAFTLHQGNSLDGRLKLGTAQLRVGELAAAESSFREALRISPLNPEAMNGLGMVQARRNRSRDALAWFEAALKQQPNYPPALLNVAVVFHSTPGGRPQALQYYQQYLALNPRPANWDAVNAEAIQLDQELKPAPVTRPQIETPAPVTIARTATNFPSPKMAAASTNPPKPEPPRPPAVAPAATAATNYTVQLKATPAREQPAPAELVQLTDAPVIKPAVDSVVPSTAPSAPRGADDTMGAPDQTAAAAPVQKPPHRSFLQRVNPVNIFRHDTNTVAEDSTQPARLAMVTPGTTASPSARTAAPLDTASLTNRYTYRSPAKPHAGDRTAAERLFAQALEAQRDHRVSDAVAGYRAAAQADGSFFEAQCNLGLAAYDANDLNLSLLAYETALAIRPDSFNARFNFALALKRAGCIIDCAREMERLLVINMSESAPRLASAHLMLANLYAEQFHQPRAAHPHYLKVLALDPNNPQATTIRYWLRDNPE